MREVFQPKSQKEENFGIKFRKRQVSDFIVDWYITVF